MKKLNFRLLLSIALVATVISCKKKGCTDPLASNYDSNAEKNENCEYDTATVANYTVPSTYIFTDANDSNTVSYTGQTDRLNMLSDMVNYLKTANGVNCGSSSGTNSQLDTAQLFAMYANEAGANFTGTVGSSGKDLESKTASSVTIQQQFRDWMTGAVNATPSTSDSYLQDSTGQEWTQLIEKGLMGACFAYQITDNYLTDSKIGSGVNNLTPDAGKLYTDMEHHWDEGYGYFTDKNDYSLATDRFWTKYANKTYMSGLGAEIAEAFRKGRAAITASRLAGGNGLSYHADVLAQRDIIVAKVYRLVAGMAIHYLYETKTKVANGASNSSVYHSMSEAYAFMYGLHTLNSGTWANTISGLLSQIDANFDGFCNSAPSIDGTIQTIANAAGISDPSSFQ